MGFKTVEELEKRKKEYIEKYINTKEEWRQLKAFDVAPIYKISNLGKISKNDGTLLIPYNKQGYDVIYLKNEAGVSKQYRVHRLVVATFIPVSKKYIEQGYTMDTLLVNHINGIKNHNAVFNLEWCTAKENSVHAHKTGLVWKLYGENNAQSKFSDETMEQVCECLSKGMSNKDIKDKLDVTDSVIYSLVRRDIRDALTNKFVFLNRRKELSDEDIHNICRDMVSKKLGIYKLAKKWNLSVSYLYGLARYEYHPEITTQYPLADCVRPRKTDDEIRAIWKDILAKELSISKIAEKHCMSSDYIKELKSGNRRPDIRKEFIKD